MATLLRLRGIFSYYNMRIDGEGTVSNIQVLVHWDCSAANREWEDFEGRGMSKRE